MTALTIHIDDSGTHAESPVAVAAGWIAPVPQWKKFIRQWRGMKKKHGFEVFHMVDAMASSQSSEFRGWGENKKTNVLRDLCPLIDARISRGFAIWVIKRDYDELVTGDLRIQLGKSHYTWAVCNLIGWIELWRERENIREPIEYIFDRMSKGRGEIDQVFRSAEERGNELHKYGIYKGCHSFRDKAEVLPLQAADMIAWLTYQRALEAASGIRPRSLVSETFNYFNNRRFKCASMSREHLTEYVQQESGSRHLAESGI
jgi:hypothetical protein